MEAYGFAMGPFAVFDLAGLEIAWARRKRQAATRDPKARYVDIADHLCEAGRLGMKAGRGWYRYQDGKRAVDPDVTALIEQRRAAKDIAPRDISDDEIRQRLLAAMAAEGAALLSEGIADARERHRSRDDQRLRLSGPQGRADVRRRPGQGIKGMSEAFIVDGVRTPIGRYGGALARVRPDDLAAHVDQGTRQALSRDRRRRGSTRSFSDAPTRPARTIAMSPAWPPCWPACPSRFPAPPSTACAAPASMRSATPRA